MSTFKDMQQKVKTLKSKPSNDDLLFLYSHFNQAEAGDPSGKRPGAFDFVKRAKFDAWAKLKGMDKAQAEQLYIDKVQALLAAQGLA